ncbi:hypothetical protein RHGRI_027581 [Rhododendron griersonianum]|uniref:Uncharacterized protein n=1 Tax=Rhododendron griersonianum TaxID=479676 RepID=A0AAV6IZU6_9ERIC|nr:hypothetical protein RHGRI_027581 [Rhododendron griersonianum]
MEEHQVVLAPPPHVLIFPFPAQSHVNSMLKLAELLCHAGLHVTFLVTHFTHCRLLRHSNVHSHFTRYPGFRFETITDGLPEDDPRSGENIVDLLKSFGLIAKPLLTELLISDREKNADSAATGRKKITCIVADGLSSFTIDVAEEIGIPVFCFRTASACNFWAYFCVPKLIENGELPFKGKNLDVLVTSIPGMDGFLRRRDLPSFCRVGDVTHPDFQLFVNETLKSSRAQGLILNTLEELEGPILAQTRSQFPKIYTIGPLQTHLKSRLKVPICSNSLWEEDMSCITWLNAQPLRSVVYVSFGSLTMVTKDQLIEFLHDTCDRHIIEKMVRKLMDEMRVEFKQSTDLMAKLAKNAVSEGGSSYSSLDGLIEDIRLMCVD